MRRTLLIGVLATSLLLGGRLIDVGGASDTDEEAPQPTVTTEHVIELWVPGCGSSNGGCRFSYRLRDLDGRRTGDFVTSSQPYYDADGDVVGRHRLQWLSSPNTTNDKLIGFNTFVASLRAGPDMERGTITAFGYLHWRSLGTPVRGVSELAITGGTGAYRGATGYVTEAYDPGRDAFAITWHIIDAGGV